MLKKILFILYRHFLWNKWTLPQNSGRGIEILASSFIRDYKQKRIPYREIYSIHKKGFTVSDWVFLGLNNNNYKKYLSNAQYYAMHPLNGQYTAWIDDKLTLKYICSGTKLDQYMPAYFYQIDGDGKILCLMDCPRKSLHGSVEDVAQLLVEKRELAIKLIAGSIGAGFYKAEYKDNCYLLNGNALSKEGFCAKIGELRNYLVIEYLHPHKELAAYCPDTVNTIRYLTGRINGSMQLIKSYIRFGTVRSGFVENYNIGGVLCYLDENGYFKEGNIIDQENKENKKIQKHPDTNRPLTGRIPHWERIVEAGQDFDEFLPQMKYLGIDFVVTSDDRVKVLEINSLTSLDALELNGSILQTDAGKFFRVG